MRLHVSLIRRGHSLLEVFAPDSLSQRFQVLLIGTPEARRQLFGDIRGSRALLFLLVHLPSDLLSDSH